MGIWNSSWRLQPAPGPCCWRTFARSTTPIGWGKSDYQQLPLSPLGPEAIDELLLELLGSDPTVAGLRALIRERTGGNPFFIEEVVQSLVESEGLSGSRGTYRLVTPVDELAIPATVQAVLAARIDRLPEREKQVLQTAAVAAVVDKRFSESLLRRVVGLPEPDLAAALSRLHADEFLVEEALYPELEYGFKHPLTQSVAYDRQLSDRRAEIHAAMARGLEEIHADKLDEQAALIAHHWEQAREPLTAARWHVRAARYLARTNIEAALGHWQSSRELTDQGAGSSEALGLALAARIGLLDTGGNIGRSMSEVEALLSEGRELASQLGDELALANLLVSGGHALLFAGDIESALARFLEARHLADGAGDQAVSLDATLGASWAHNSRGSFADALALTDEAVAALQGQSLTTPREGRNADVQALRLRSWTLMGLDRLDEAQRDVDRALTLANDRDAQEWLMHVHSTVAGLAQLRGDPERMIGYARTTLELADRMGNVNMRVQAMRDLANGHALRRQWEDAKRLLEEAVTTAREAGTYLNRESGLLLDLARVYHSSGETHRNQATVEEVLRIATERGAHGDAAQAHRIVARLAAGRGDDDSVRVHHLREAQRLFIEIGATRQAERVTRDLEHSTQP